MKKVKRTKSSGNVFRDLGLGPKASENLLVRARLIIEIEKYIQKEKITQAEAAKLFGVTQPRISDLIRGKIHLFSVDILIAMLSHAGLTLISGSESRKPLKTLLICPLTAPTPSCTISNLEPFLRIQDSKW